MAELEKPREVQVSELAQKLTNISEHLVQAQDLSKQTAERLPRLAYKTPERCHNTRRAVWLEIVAIYGTFIALAIWNWW